jgi:5-methylcytosine-specific restriction enzyme subunit McrC
VVTAGLTIDMAALCETFVRVALRDAQHASDVQFRSGDGCPLLHLDTARRVALRPDLSYWRGRSCVYVGDVKYKRDGGPGQHDDLYQLLAYATATQLPRAMLIYAAGPPAPLTHLVAPPGIQLQIRHLDLTQPPSDILEQLAGIADEIATAAVVARAQRDVLEVPVRRGAW